MRKFLLHTVSVLFGTVIALGMASAQTYELDLTVGLDIGSGNTQYNTTVAIENLSGQTVYSSPLIPLSYTSGGLMYWNYRNQTGSALKLSPGTYKIRIYTYANDNYRDLEREDTIEIVTDSYYFADFRGGTPLRWYYVYFGDDYGNYIEFEAP